MKSLAQMCQDHTRATGGNRGAGATSSQATSTSASLSNASIVGAAPSGMNGGARILGALPHGGAGIMGASPATELPNPLIPGG